MIPMIFPRKEACYIRQLLTLKMLLFSGKSNQKNFVFGLSPAYGVLMSRMLISCLFTFSLCIYIGHLNWAIFIPDFFFHTVDSRYLEFQGTL